MLMRKAEGVNHSYTAGGNILNGDTQENSLVFL